MKKKKQQKRHLKTSRGIQRAIPRLCGGPVPCRDFDRCNQLLSIAPPPVVRQKLLLQPLLADVAVGDLDVSDLPRVAEDPRLAGPWDRESIPPDSWRSIVRQNTAMSASWKHPTTRASEAESRDQNQLTGAINIRAVRSVSWVRIDRRGARTAELPRGNHRSSGCSHVNRRSTDRSKGFRSSRIGLNRRRRCVVRRRRSLRRSLRRAPGASSRRRRGALPLCPHVALWPSVVCTPSTSSSSQYSATATRTMMLIGYALQPAGFTLLRTVLSSKVLTDPVAPKKLPSRNFCGKMVRISFKFRKNRKSRLKTSPEVELPFIRA